MKAFYLSLLILCLNLGLGLITVTNPFLVQAEYDTVAINSIKNQYENLDDYEKPLDDKVEFQTEDPDNADKSIGLWSAIGRCIFPNVFLEKTLRIDPYVALLGSVPIYLIYMIGIAQLLGALKGGKSAI